MKITLDLDLLLSEGKITEGEYQKFNSLAAQSTGSLAFNILVGFGVIAVSGGVLALVPFATTAIVIGLIFFLLGLFLLKSEAKQWIVLANICVLVGSLMTGGGLVSVGEGNLISILIVTILFIIGSILAQSSLLAVLSTLMLSAAVGARTGYYHASYFLAIQEPFITIVLFTALAIGLYLLSKRLTPHYERIALAGARTGVFLVNFGFWIGSLWGEKTGVDHPELTRIPSELFAILWALALVATAVWGWRKNRRWVVNTVATFAGIHFYTQWFENLGASALSILLGGVIVLLFALALHRINSFMVKKTVS